MNLTTAQLAKYFDHTLLKAYATTEDFKAFCADCAQYGFAMAAINPAPVKLVKSLLKQTDVHVGAAIGFPLGPSRPNASRRWMRLQTVRTRLTMSSTSLNSKTETSITFERKWLRSSLPAERKRCSPRSFLKIAI